MMNDNRTMPEDNIVELRRRSQSGFLHKVATSVTPIIATDIGISEEDYQALIASVLDD